MRRPVQEEDVSEAATNLVHLSQELTQRRINITQDRLIAIFTNKSGCSRGIDLADVQHKGLGKNVPLGLVERTVAYLLEHDVLTHHLVTNASGFNNTYIVPVSLRSAVSFFVVLKADVERSQSRRIFQNLRSNCLDL